MIDDEHDATGLQCMRDLIEHGARIDLRPAVLRRNPVQIVIDLVHQRRVECSLAQAHAGHVDGAVLDVREVMLLDALAPDVVRERIVGGVVEQQHVALRSDDEAQQLAVVTARGEYIDDVHAGLDAGQAHHLGGLLGGIAFQIVVAAAGVRDGGVVDVGVARGDGNRAISDSAISAVGEVSFLCRWRTWQAPRSGDVARCARIVAMRRHGACGFCGAEAAMRVSPDEMRRTVAA